MLSILIHCLQPCMRDSHAKFQKNPSNFFPWDPFFSIRSQLFQFFLFLIIFSFIVSVNADHELKSAQELLRRSIEPRDKAKNIPEVPIEKMLRRPGHLVVVKFFQQGSVTVFYLGLDPKYLLTVTLTRDPEEMARSKRRASCRQATGVRKVLLNPGSRKRDKGQKRRKF